MNAIKVAIVTVVAAVSLSAVSQTVPAQGKTREQVRQELVQAQHDGTIPVSNVRYPNTPEMTANNQARHAYTNHPGETKPGLDHHDATR